MKYITFSYAGILAGVANMLEQIGHNVTDREIALGMEAPYLLVHEDGQYHAGAGLYKPAWINLYLIPRGYQLVETTVEQNAVAAYLRSHAPAMLKIGISGSNKHPVVFNRYEAGRYHFVNIKSAQCVEPDSISLTSATLKRRLEDTVTIYTLSSCEPRPIDMIPLLMNSLKNLADYQEDLLSVRKEVITREQLKLLDPALFRALMIDLRPMMLLIDQPYIAEELRLLNHDYKHIFTHNDGDSIAVSDRLPKYPIKNCINWMREEIIDRLYALGTPEEIIDSLVTSPANKVK